MHLGFSTCKLSWYQSVYVLTEEPLLHGQYYQWQHCWQDIMSSVALTSKPIWTVKAKENFCIMKSVLLRSKIYAVLVDSVSWGIHPAIYPSNFLRSEIINISIKLTINSFFLAKDIMNMYILRILIKHSDALVLTEFVAYFSISPVSCLWNISLCFPFLTMQLTSTVYSAITVLFTFSVIWISI